MTAIDPRGVAVYSWSAAELDLSTVTAAQIREQTNVLRNLALEWSAEVRTAIELASGAQLDELGQLLGQMSGALQVDRVGVSHAIRTDTRMRELATNAVHQATRHWHAMMTVDETRGRIVVRMLPQAIAVLNWTASVVDELVRSALAAVGTGGSGATESTATPDAMVGGGGGGAKVDSAPMTATGGSGGGGASGLTITGRGFPVRCSWPVKGGHALQLKDPVLPCDHPGCPGSPTLTLTPTGWRCPAHK